VRDAVAVNELGKSRKTSGWWLRLGSKEDLGNHPAVTLNGRRLRLRRDPDDRNKWDVRLARVAATGPVYVNCGERTNRAFLTVAQRPLAMPTATDQGDGSWRLDARGSVDRDGQLNTYTWTVGGRTLEGRSVELPADQYARSATLVVADDDRLKDDRTVSLTATVARTYPSDLLFCFDCRRLGNLGRRRVRAMRHDIVGARLVRIRVHTDERGSEAHNKDLAEARARAVKEALLKGMNRPPKVLAKGVGEEDPSQEGDHRQNRRVEVFIYRGPEPS
jgi:outer membrane protein OmpA-like peptidoglycan-associated protein